MLRITGGALGSLLVPFIFMGLALAGIWELEQALRGTTIALVVSLVVIGYLAARRARLRTWQKVIVLLAEFAVGAGVLALELLAHA